jgi:3-deoxy-D-manno-octulosonic-acid transferase
MYLVYNILFTLLAPLWVPWMWWRTKQRKESPNWTERQGNYEKSLPKKPKGEKRIWLHAVSVGEVVAARPILEEFRKQTPNAKIVLSVTTSSGHQTAREKLEGLFDYLIYFPIDAARFQLRAMQWVRPDVVAIMETELWFNFLWAADVFDTPVYLVNGRSSDRAFARSMKFRWFFQAMLKYVKSCLVQTETDKKRYESLGASSAEVFGNTKFDEAAGISLADSSQWKQELGIPADKQVVVVGSTRSEQEESWVLDAYFKNSNAVFVHAPRHLETAPRIIEAFNKRNNQGKVIGSRSKKESGDYIILDSYGELGAVYSVADLVIIGGGFDTLGGQNLIQPLALGKPVLHGQNMFNFRDVAAASVRDGASVICATSEELGQKVQELLNETIKRNQMGQAASRLVHDNLGASERYAKQIVSHLNT